MEELLRLAEQNGIEPGDLDEDIYDFKSGEAALINNGGLAAQIEYLLEIHGGNVNLVKQYLQREVE